MSLKVDRCFQGATKLPQVGKLGVVVDDLTILWSPVIVHVCPQVRCQFIDGHSGSMASGAAKETENGGEIAQAKVRKKLGLSIGPQNDGRLDTESETPR